MTSDHGTEFLLDLPETVALKDGNALALDDGSFIIVKAAPERLLKITCKDALHLSRIAWHLGNRHLAAQISADHILIRYDHVIAELVKGLGANVQDVEAPFEPESGAYAHGHAHG